MAIKNLRIGGINYQVVHTNGLRGNDDARIYGSANYPSATIEIEAGHDPQVQFVTLIHESIHCILNHAGIAEHDEHIVEVIANGLVPFLQDNIANLLPGLEVKDA